MCRNVDALSGKRFEVHLDAGLGRIPEHLVPELLQVKIGAKVAIQPSENIQVEGGGGSGSIIVGGQQHRLGLVPARFQVGAQPFAKKADLVLAFSPGQPAVATAIKPVLKANPDMALSQMANAYTSTVPLVYCLAVKERGGGYNEAIAQLKFGVPRDWMASWVIVTW